MKSGTNRMLTCAIDDAGYRRTLRSQLHRRRGKVASFAETSSLKQYSAIYVDSTSAW